MRVCGHSEVVFDISTFLLDVFSFIIVRETKASHLLNAPLASIQNCNIYFLQQILRFLPINKWFHGFVPVVPTRAYEFRLEMCYFRRLLSTYVESHEDQNVQL